MKTRLQNLIIAVGLLANLVASLQITEADQKEYRPNRKLVFDDGGAEIIETFETQLNDDKTTFSVTLKVNSKEPTDKALVDPVDRLVLVRDDADGPFQAIDADKVGPGVFHIDALPAGTWRLESPDLTGGALERNEVDHEHVD